ncbi:alpha-(1,3)-fucosyltransferase 7 isoform X1 [Gadus morhua]|uniref:Fucosyltransferase n=2 Tax=Gadus morhua TaxID=8049 RepID=A0A8C5CC99_GADMO|nr:alpha-(1,3)-fucosyltransferase 7-like isoform X1 [Gadus morhua]
MSLQVADRMTLNPLIGLMKGLLVFLLCLPFPLLLLCELWMPPKAAWGEPAPHPNVTVLLWHWPFGVALDLEGDVCLKRYNVSSCRLRSDRSTFATADVVVFHNRELVRGLQALPLVLPRPQGQRWVWMSLESPPNNGDLRPFADLFNLTMSYRRDADIHIPYGKLVPRGPGDGEEPVLHNKSVPVCWVVSSYRPDHRRSRLYAQLIDSVPVTVYGRWNHKALSPEDLLPTISQCYFYLAFENSESRDYITEKLWRNAYQSGAVPVVLGPPLKDYKAVAPRSSFIHVDEFASVGELGRRLRELVSDEESYSHFLGWQKEWRVKQYTDWRERLCSICSQHDSLPKHKIYTDLEAWVNV